VGAGVVTMRNPRKPGWRCVAHQPKVAPAVPKKSSAGAGRRRRDRRHPT
jgi:hypothetical protein